MFIITFIIYVVIVLVIAVWIYRRDKVAEQSHSEEFWTGGQKISGASLGLSISATMMSISWSVVYGSELFYRYGFGGIWLLGVPWFITIAFFWLAAPWMRRQKVFSQPELLGKVFGGKFRIYTGVVLALVFLTWAAGEIYAAGIILSPLLGISPVFAMAVIAVVIALYSMLGGFAAVVATDKIQFLFVGLFMILIISFGLSFLELPVNGLFARGGVTDSFFSPGLPLIALTFFAYLPGWFVETDVWLRIQAASDDRQARIGAAVALFNTVIFVILLPMAIGFMAHLWDIPNDAEAVSGMISSIIGNPGVPVIWQIALFLGLISAAMSTIDTCTNVVALSMGNDIYGAVADKRNKISRLNIARITTLIAIFLAFLFAVYINSLWDVFYLSSGLLTTAIFIPVILALRGSDKKNAAWLATLTGLIFTFVFFFLEQAEFFRGFYPVWLEENKLGYLVWGLGGSLAGFFIGYLIDLKKTNKNRGS